MIAETLPPPRLTVGPLAWLRKNLFSGWVSSLATGLIGGLLLVLTINIGGWALTEARWDVVSRNARLFLVGQYPADQLWRIWLALALLSVLTGVSAGIFGRTSRALAIALSALQALFAALILLSPLGPLAALLLAANAAAVWIGFAAGVRRLIPRRVLVYAWLASLPASFLLLSGIAGTPVPSVPSNLWGGLLLTV